MKRLSTLSILFILFSCQEKTEEIAVANPEAKMLFITEFASEPVDGIKTIEKTSYYLYSNAATNDELCATKSILSDVAYKEVWIIHDKNDPMLNRTRESIEKVDANEVLTLMCEKNEKAVYGITNLEKYGMQYKEFKAFFN